MDNEIFCLYIWSVKDLKITTMNWIYNLKSLPFPWNKKKSFKIKNSNQINKFQIVKDEYYKII